MEPEKQIPCPFVCPEAAGREMEHPHPSPAPRTDTTLRAIAETNAQNDPRNIVQTAEITGG